MLPWSASTRVNQTQTFPDGSHSCFVTFGGASHPSEREVNVPSLRMHLPAPEMLFSLKAAV